MARLLGIPYFQTDASVEETRQDNSDLRKAKKMDDNGLSAHRVQIKAVRRIQQQFQGHVLRRTTNSRNWQGNPLLNIPPHKDIIGILTLTDRETEILAQRAEDAKAKSVLNTLFVFILFLINWFVACSVMSGNDTGKFQTRVRLRLFD